MDRYLYRGKIKNGDKFVVGFIYKSSQNEDMIINIQGGGVVVDPTTIGQCTGLKDKNGELIFEGDIIKVGIWSHRLSNVGPIEAYIAEGNEEVIYRDGCFGFLWGFRREFNTFRNFVNTHFEIVGNVHDNPELMEVGL